MKRNCVNFVDEKKHPKCNCLKELYCEYKEECSFYKPLEDYKMQYNKDIGFRVPEKRWKI